MSILSTVKSFASTWRGGLKSRAARVYIVPLNIHQKDAVLPGELKAFQYFPETISDTKATNIQAKVIPGLSHPLYQWTSSGARVIAFQAIFTRDRSMSDGEWAASRTATARDSSGKSSNDFSSSSSFFKQAQTQAFGSGLGEVSTKDQDRDVDIPSAIAWLRSYIYPEFTTDGSYTDNGVSRPFPPRKLILGLPGMRINWGERMLPPDEIYATMTQCDVVYESFFADGTPRLARVTLAFAEIIQVGGQILNHDASLRREFGELGYLITNYNSRGV